MTEMTVFDNNLTFGVNQWRVKFLDTPLTKMVLQSLLFFVKGFWISNPLLNQI